jgi:hypothetical protein
MGPPSGPAADGEITVVLDSAWTAGPDDAATGRTIGIRGVGGRLLAEWDVIAETADLLDTWAATSDIADRLVIDGTSMWFYLRVSTWVWLQQRVLWVAVMDALVADTRPSRIAIDADVDEEVAVAARLVAARDGLAVTPESTTAGPNGTIATTSTAPTARPASSASTGRSTTQASAASTPTPTRLTRRARSLARGVLARLTSGRVGAPRPTPAAVRAAAIRQRRQVMAARRASLAQEPGRLLVVMEHARQRVETAAGPRDVNPFLSPVVDALHETALEPILVEIWARLSDDASWARLTAADGQRSLSWPEIVDADAASHPAVDGDAADDGAAWAAAVRSISTPVIAHGVDLGPALVEHIADLAAATMPRKVRAVATIRRLLRQLRPAGVLLADEYHRQDWLAAARAEGVPVAAIQHGMIYARHNGYIHRSRPDSLVLADRTYVFGEWERELLIERSVYRQDEVAVSGSPRLDLVTRAPDIDAAGLRAELGVQPGHRLVVLSGTHGPAYRRFHIPYALDRLLDRPWPNVHLVVKQHPGERDRGPYETLIAGLAAARGFEAPPVTVVKDVDLYRLLRAADAHLGIHSTVLTEAVAAGTRNLLADTLASADLLGYVDAGVAIPVRDGTTFLIALDPAAAADADVDARAAFLARHFREGSASLRLRDDLLAWLAP